MKIGIDGVPLTIPFPCGTKHYAQELINSLAKIDKKNEYVIFVSERVLIPKQKNFRLIKIPSVTPILKRQLFLSAAAKKEKLDLFHYLEPYGAVFFQHPRIITTVHDVNLSPTYPVLSRHFFNRIYCEITRRGVFKNTKVFIAVSNFTKRELKRYLGRRNNRDIFVVNNGISNNFRVKKVPKGNVNYFLTMGDFTPRKNILKVLEAYSLLPLPFKNEYKLKIVANEKSVRDKFLTSTKSLGIQTYSEVFQAVSEEKLIDLYGGAAAFLYPSLYEGFGLPILEAMSCGCPVITSNMGATKETAGGAAYLVSPKNPGGITNAMRKIISNPRLKNTLVASGLKRAKDFSWEETARKTLEIYQNTFSGNV